MDETAKLADFVANLSYSDLPSGVVHTAKLCLLDTLGVGLFASQMPWTKIVAQIGDERRGAEESVVWGRSAKVPAEYAALANGLPLMELKWMIESRVWAFIRAVRLFRQH